MDETRLRSILEKIQDGSESVEKGLEQLKGYPFENIGYATVDHHRPLRQGAPEVVFGEGKTTEQIVGIVKRITAQQDNVLITRLSEEKALAVRAEIPDALYHPLSRTMTVEVKEVVRRGRGMILVICAGTSDLPVADEAVVTAGFLGNDVKLLADMGVSGVHRILAHRDLFEQATVFIVVAGMEGALPSVVGGLVRRPVIAVPTSIGYGASFNGLAALLGMLNSCASNVTVVNIDNGFGAGYVAGLINSRD